LNSRHLVDPELLPLIDTQAIPIDFGNLSQTRIDTDAMFDQLPSPENEGVTYITDNVRVLVFTPPGERLRPAVLHIHGGGMVIGSAHGFRRGPAAMAIAADAVVVSVDYRLAPETPFPGPQEDCYAALAWLFGNADTLGVDPGRIAIAGESAGAGLAAAVALMARDRGAPPLCAQILTYPMLDHRTGGPDCPWRNPVTGEFVWTRSHNRFGWDALRGDYALDDERIGWFSPARAIDLSGLPPTWIGVGSLDLFVDESFDYARRLIASGVSTEFNCYAGAPHGFNILAAAQVSQALNRDLIAATRRWLGVGLPGDNTVKSRTGR
jgi:acetyl esterase